MDNETKTKTAHTPGPWQFEEATGTIRSVPTNYWLASMDSWDGAVSTEANAHLIAAAPNLLEVAMTVVLMEENREAGFPPDRDEWEEAVKAARAAIAKARGDDS